MTTRKISLKTRAFSFLAAGALVASIGTVAALGADDAYAAGIPVGDRTDVTATDPTGIEPRESWPNKQYYFNFTDNTNNTSPTTGWKDNATSFWVKINEFNVDYCNFFADAYAGGWVDCTVPGYGRAYGTGEYELYNNVWEWYGHVECRLGGYRAQIGQGWVTGEWTPDCEGYFTIMR